MVNINPQIVVFSRAANKPASLSLVDQSPSSLKALFAEHNGGVLEANFYRRGSEYVSVARILTIENSLNLAKEGVFNKKGEKLNISELGYPFACDSSSSVYFILQKGTVVFLYADSGEVFRSEQNVNDFFASIQYHSRPFPHSHHTLPLDSRYQKEINSIAAFQAREFLTAIIHLLEARKILFDNSVISKLTELANKSVNEITSSETKARYILFSQTIKTATDYWSIYPQIISDVIRDTSRDPSQPDYHFLKKEDNIFETKYLASQSVRVRNFLASYIDSQNIEELPKSWWTNSLKEVYGQLRDSYYSNHNRRIRLISKLKKRTTYSWHPHVIFRITTQYRTIEGQADLIFTSPRLLSSKSKVNLNLQNEKANTK